MTRVEMPKDWDKKLAKLGGQVFQSSLWAEFQDAQGRQVLLDEDDDWQWQAAIRDGRLGFSYLYAAYGPTVSDAKSLRRAVRSLRVLGKKHNLDFVRIEPIGGSVSAGEMKKLGLKRVSDMNPSSQMVLDLAQSEAEIRHNMSPSNRNLINTAPKRGLEFIESSDPADMDDLIRLQRAAAERAGWRPQADKYYHQLAASLMTPGSSAVKLYFAELGNVRIAAGLCLDFADTRYYLFAGTDPELNAKHKAAVALLWHMITDAKAKGLKKFHYGGVAPEGAPANHPYTGHTRFKKSIGGDTITGVGTWDIPLKPVKYALYTLLKKVV